MGQQRRRGVNLKAWVGLVVGTVVLGLVIFSQADDPGPTRLVLSLVAGFVLSAVGWVLLAEGYDALRGRR